MSISEEYTTSRARCGPMTQALWHSVVLLSFGVLGCGEDTVVHQDVPSDGICIEASEMFASPEPGPCRLGIARCTTGPETRVAYTPAGVERLRSECPDTLEMTPSP